MRVPAFAKDPQDLLARSRPITLQELYTDSFKYDVFIGYSLERNTQLGQSAILHWSTKTKIPKTFNVTEMFCGKCPMLGSAARMSRPAKYKTNLTGVDIFKVEPAILDVRFLEMDAASITLLKEIKPGTQHIVFASTCSIGYLPPEDWQAHMKVVSEMLVRGGAYYIFLGNYTSIAQTMSYEPSWSEIDMPDGTKHYITDFLLEESSCYGSRRICTAYASKDWKTLWHTTHRVYCHTTAQYQLWRRELGFRRCIPMYQEQQDDGLFRITEGDPGDSADVVCMIK